jgi:hypothetical protein
MNDEKVRAKLDILANGEKDIEKKLDEFIEDQEKIDDKQNKDLVTYKSILNYERKCYYSESH